MAKKSKQSKLKKRLLQAAVLSVLAGLVAWLVIPSPVAVQVAEVRVGSFSTTVEAQGKTQARDRIIVWAPVAGIPQRMPLAVGAAVVVKQIVARLAPDRDTFQSAQTIRYLTERATTAATAKDRAWAERQQTAVVVNPARANLRDAEQRAASGVANAAQRDQAQVAMKLIFKELDSMDAAVQSAAFDSTAAESALRQIKNQPPDEWVLHAPTSGTVLAVADNGKPVAIGATLVEIGNPLDLEVVVETDASAATQISAGQRVELKPAHEDALPGRVRRVVITPSETATPGSARIVIEFAAPPAKWQALGNNRALHARITLATIDSVLKIPSTALIADGPHSVVFVIADGRARKRVVTLSARDTETAVVASGLKEGERVIIAPDAKIKDGVRVQPI